VDNPRKRGKSRKVESSWLLKAKHYVIEQFNGHLKANVLGECWVWPVGLVKKAAMVMAGLISYNAEAMQVDCCWR
jgi:hypothetical protein